ncbi:MAG: hypothetical protein JG782_1429 [Anaerophaga sp.]|nr:hypothetical protein [Anaerophaga sp.]
MALFAISGRGNVKKIFPKGPISSTFWQITCDMMISNLASNDGSRY